MTTQEIDKLAAQGLDAFRRGDAPKAFDALSAAADAGAQARDVHMALAIVARMLGRHERCVGAVSTVIAQEPRNVEALIIKADALKGLGDLRQATTFYMTAVRAAPPKERMTDYLATEVARARQACASAAKTYEDFLRAHAAKAGFKDPKGTTRIGQALDIMFGRRQVYVQEPLKFYFPELPQIQFYDPDQFPWRADIEEATSAIKAEALAAWQGQDGVEPYVPAKTHKPHLEHHAIMGDDNWSAFHLYKDGVANEENMARCPRTVSALKLAPQARIPDNSPISLFSVLQAGAHIPPHRGMMNVRLICHLPLVVPEKCVLRVGNQERNWREGELLVFDDSIEHEASNGSDQTRIVLLFDIWRPELTEDEQHFVAAIYGGIEAFSDPAPST